MPITHLHQFPVEPDLNRPPPLPADSFNAGTGNFLIDLQVTPPDETLLLGENLNNLLTAEIIPWRRFGHRLVYVTGKEEIDAPQRPDGVRYVNFIAADPEFIRQYIAKHITAATLDTARNLCPKEFSCRNFRINPFKPTFIIGLAFIITTLAAFPKAWLMVLLIWVMITNLATSLLRFFALLTWRKDNALPYWLPESAPYISRDKQDLKVTILIPLFKEAALLRFVE